MWGCACAMRAILAGSHQLHRGAGVGYQHPMSPKTLKMNELGQCRSRMVPEKIWNQIRVKWETLKDDIKMRKSSNSQAFDSTGSISLKNGLNRKSDPDIVV